MTQKQEALLSLSTLDPQALVDNLSNTNLTLEGICEEREKSFLSSLDSETYNSLLVNGVVDDLKLIDLLQTKQLQPTPELPPYSPYESQQAKDNAEARAYLASTDWYVTRYTETGTEVPEEITSLRNDARNSIVE